MTPTALKASESDRLSRLESQNENMLANLSELTLLVEDMRKTQGTLADKFALVGRWDAKTILSMFGLVMTPVVAMWGLAIAPIQQELQLHRLYQERLDGRANENAHAIVQSNERFIEIETQFRQVIENQNMSYDNLEGRVSELWKLETGRDMSRRIQYPDVGHERK